MKLLLIIIIITLTKENKNERTITEKERTKIKGFIELLEMESEGTERIEFPYVTYRNITYKIITIDTAMPIDIEDIVKKNNLPNTMKGVILEIIKENDMDEVFVRFSGLKDSLGEIELNYSYIVHLQSFYDDENKFKIIYIIYSNSKIGVEPSFQVVEKYVCNKGFLIQPCKNIKVYNKISYFNDAFIKNVTETSNYDTKVEFIKFLKNIYDE